MQTDPSSLSQGCRLVLAGFVLGGLLQACDFTRMADDRPLKLPEESFEPAGPQLTPPEETHESGNRDAR